MMTMSLEIIIGLELVVDALMDLVERVTVNLNARPLTDGRTHDKARRIRLLVKTMAPRAAR